MKKGTREKTLPDNPKKKKILKRKGKLFYLNFNLNRGAFLWHPFSFSLLKIFIAIHKF